MLATLLYLSNHSRPDVLKELVHLASKVSDPREEDMNKLTKVFGYLLHTSNLGITFRTSSLQPTIYCDASFGVHSTGHSHTGLVFSLGDRGPIYAKSKKQKSITLSSCESEMLGLTNAAEVAIEKAKLLDELGIWKGPVIIYQDNKSTIELAECGEGAKTRSKYFRTRFQFISNLIGENIIKLKFISTKDQIADLLTKPMGGKMLREQRDRLLNV
jgi:hypothetical protein